jgi:hypothetical protein
MKNNKIHDNNTLLNELVQMQRTKIPLQKKISFVDMKRICKNINSSIFDTDNCCLWQGYITNNDHPEKGVYINFYFKGKKVALHRILYINYVDNLNSDEYLKYVCNNVGKCCNMHHLKKFKYKKGVNTNETDKKKQNNEPIKDTHNILNVSEISDNNLYIAFD